MSADAPRDAAIWAKRVEDDDWLGVSDEEVVAAYQEYWRASDIRLAEGLLKRIMARLLEVVRGAISHDLPDEGWEAVHRTLENLHEGLAEDGSPNGKGLRTTFVGRASVRATDAVRALLKEKARSEPLVEHGEIDGAVENWTAVDARLDLETAMAALSDPSERLAFALHYDKAPIEGEDSMAVALGVSGPTARKILTNARRKVQARLRLRPPPERGRD